MDLITVVMVGLATGVVVVTVVLTVVAELAAAAVATAAAAVAAVMGTVVLIGLLLQQVMDMMVVQEQDMATAEGMAMEAMLALGLVLAVGMVAPCMEALMVHMVPTVVVLMEGVRTEVVLMEVAPMVEPQVAMVLEDMVATGVLVEQAVLLVAVRVLGVLAGTIHMENKRQVKSGFLGPRVPHAS